MAIVLKSSDEEAGIHGIKIMVYSKAGIGKTMLIATAPNPILISAESGLLSLKKENIERVFGPDDPDITYNLPVIVIKTIADLVEAYEWCAHSAEANHFDTIGIDSLSEIAEVVLDNAKKQVKDKRQAYGELLEQMNDTIRKFRDLKGKNVYVVTKQEYSKDEATGAQMYGPSLPGSKLSQGIAYFYDIVCHMGIAKTTDGDSYRYLRTQPDLQYEAKDRSGALEEIEQPNLTYIFNKILKGE
jgi:hypothetical protein